MRCELRDSLTWLILIQVAGKPQRAALDVARGGTVAFAVLLNETRPGEAIQVSLSPAPKKWFAYRLIDVPVEHNTGITMFCERDGRINPHVVRRAPFRVFDAMEPVAPVGFKANATTQALVVHVPVPRNARPGTSLLKCSVRHGREQAGLSLRVTAHAAQVPLPGARSFFYTNWYSVENMATRHG